MAKMKIYEIARSMQQQDKNIKSGDLVKLLNDNGFEVRGANSNIEDDAIAFLKIETLEKSRHIFTHREWHMIGYAVRVDELAEKKKEEKKLSAQEIKSEEAGKPGKKAEEPKTARQEEKKKEEPKAAPAAKEEPKAPAAAVRGKETARQGEPRRFPPGPEPQRGEPRGQSQRREPWR